MTQAENIGFGWNSWLWVACIPPTGPFQPRGKLMQHRNHCSMRQVPLEHDINIDINGCLDLQPPPRKAHALEALYTSFNNFKNLTYQMAKVENPSVENHQLSYLSCPRNRDSTLLRTIHCRAPLQPSYWHSWTNWCDATHIPSRFVFLFSCNHNMTRWTGLVLKIPR